MCNFAGTILGSLFTPWWIIVAPTGRCFLSWTSTVHSHRAAPEAHRPFPQPPVSPVHGLVASTTSAFFFIPQALLPPFPPLRFCEGLPRGSNGVRPRPSQNRSRLFDRAMKISLWLTLASRVSRNCDPLNRAARTSSPAYRPLFFIIFRCLKSYH